VPSTDLTAQKWDLRGSINLNKFTKSGSIKVPGTYRNPLLRVEIKLRGLKTSWNRLGYLHQVHAGATHPKGHYLSVHDQILQLANLAPYSMFIQLVPWAVREAQSGRLSGSLRFFESGTNLKPSDLSNLDSFHRQQAMLVNPISINIPAEMDNSTKFTRSIASALVAGVSSILAPVNDARTGMVLRNPSAFDVYLCLSDVATSATAIAVIEPNGFYELAPADYNGAVSVICPAGAGSIAGSEMSSVAFAVGAGLEGEQIPGMSFMARFNRSNASIERSEDGGLTWVGLNNGDATGVSQAVIDANTGTIHVSNLDGSYNYGAINSTEWTSTIQAGFESVISNPANIVL
jgi:hypothetical protein